MNPNETSANGTKPEFYNREQAEQPETSSFSLTDPSESIFSTSPGYEELLDILSKAEVSNSALCNGSCLCGQCHIGQFQSQLSLPEYDSIEPIPYNDNFLSPADIERDHGSSPSIVSPVSTYSCPVVPSSPEAAMEGAKSAIDNSSGDCINECNPENSVLSAELSKPGCSRTCTGCVRPASACHDAHRLTASEVEILRKKFFKGVNRKRNSDKWTCEIRIAKKLLQDRKLKAKLWIGTFDTRCQAARALHVGRFLLSEKKKNSTDATNFEQRSQAILWDFKNLMGEWPLDADLLGRVKDLATRYGKNGSL